MKQVIFFKGSNCVPCKMVEPMLDRVKANALGNYQFVKAVDDAAWMANFGIRSVPAVVILDGDEEPVVLVGKEITSTKINALLN